MNETARFPAADGRFRADTAGTKVAPQSPAPDCAYHRYERRFPASVHETGRGCGHARDWSLVHIFGRARKGLKSFVLHPAFFRVIWRKPDTTRPEGLDASQTRLLQSYILFADTR